MSLASKLLTDGRFLPLREALDSRKVSSLELTRECLRRLQIIQPRLNCSIEILSDLALAMAESADQKIASGQTGGVLGIPIAIKDNIHIAKTKTTAGSRMLENFVAPFDSTVAEKLRKHGAVFVCKTNMDEFGMGSTNENSAFGSVKNPWHQDYVSGGSSGGSAAIVGARAVPLALGSDTGGSVRQPSSFCGTLGLKPTYGRVSRWGLISYASSFDQIGPIALDSDGLKELQIAIEGKDSKDSTSKNFSRHQNSGDENFCSGLKLGIPREFFADGGLDAQVSAQVRHAIDFFASRGATLVEVSLTSLKFAVPTYYILATAEASSNLARYDGIHAGQRTEGAEHLEEIYGKSRSQYFGKEVQFRILLGTYSLSKGSYQDYFYKAAQVRRIIQKDILDALTMCDFILGPTAPTEALPLGGLNNENPLQTYLADIYTLPANLAGLPAISFNVGFTDFGLPVGIQALGPNGSDFSLIRLAKEFEQNHNLISKIPKLNLEPGV